MSDDDLLNPEPRGMAMGQGGTIRSKGWWVTKLDDKATINNGHKGSGHSSTTTVLVYTNFEIDTTQCVSQNECETISL